MSVIDPLDFDPSRWPSSAEVLAELRRRNPTRYANTIKFHYTPGFGDGATLEQIVEQFERVDREMENPLLNMAARLGGEAFVLRDYAQQCTDLSGGYPGTKVPLTREQERCARLATLLRECEQLLRETAIAAAARERGDAKQAPSEGPQSGAKQSPDPHTDNHP